MSDLSDAEVQQLVTKWEWDPSRNVVAELRLDEEQKAWLYRAVMIFQAHENQSRLTRTDGKIYTEAMVRFIRRSLYGKDS